MSKRTSRGLSPAIALDRSRPGPLYLQIVACMRLAIESGRLAPGDRLAATRALAREWDVSRNTVVQAFDELIAEGYLVARVGDGSYVAARRFDAATAAPRAETRAGAGFPFRGLSRRGRAMLTRPDELGSEEPMPFRPDVPDLREFPLRSWLRLMNEISGGLKGDVLAGVSSIGHPHLRRAIAHHVAAARGLACTPDQVIVTSGSQQSLDLVVRLLVDRGDPVWMEDPGYLGIRAVLLANGCNLQFVPVDAEGLDVRAGMAECLVPRLICVSPARQYPTGATMSPRRCRELLDFAVSAGAWVLEDDYDSEMFFAGPPPRALGTADGAGRVIFSGTFSKTLVPSLRIGYLVVPRDLVPAFEAGRRVTQGHTSLLEQMVLAEMMGRGLYAAHVRRMRVLYRNRQIAFAQALRDTLGHDLPDGQLQSGTHVVLPLRRDANDRKVSDELRAVQIVARPLSPYYARRKPRPGLLLGFSAFTEEQISSAAERLRPLRQVLEPADFP